MTVIVSMLSKGEERTRLTTGWCCCSANQWQHRLSWNILKKEKEGNAWQHVGNDACVWFPFAVQNVHSTLLTHIYTVAQ